MRAAAALVMLGTLGLGACGGDDLGSGEGDATETVAKEGSAQATAILAVANDRALGVRELDIDAALDKRAATNIVAHRDGADGVLRTADDDLFDTLAELGAVKSVGTGTLKQLLAYATKKGYLADELAKKVDVVFSPQPSVEASHLARVAELIASADETIDVAMYSFSDATISKALAAAVARGVKVRFLFDTASDDKKLTGPAAASSKSGQLESKGVDVRYVNKIMHHKLMIVDGPRDDGSRAKTAFIASGSANWSNGAATRYDENTLFFTGYAELALRLQRDFDTLWDHSRDFALAAPLPFEQASFAIADTGIPEDPSTHAYFTSANFTVAGTTFSTTGANTIADSLVAAIHAAKRSIHIASGHLRSKPVSEALMAKVKETPGIEIQVYLDGQEYVSKSAHAQQVADLDACLTAAGANAAKQRACTDSGFLYGFLAGSSGVDVRYKYYAYRWDASYAKQMHDKYFVFDGETLMTGSYNLSDNAEHDTFENMLVFKGPAFAGLVADYEASFAAIRETGRAQKLLEGLTETVKTSATIPLVFEPMALAWSEITDLKAVLRANCKLIDSPDFRSNAPAHQTCSRQ